MIDYSKVDFSKILTRYDVNMQVVETPEKAAEREKEEKKMAMKPFYPDDWDNSFGVPVTQHKNVSLDTMDEFSSYKDIPEKLRE